MYRVPSGKGRLGSGRMMDYAAVSVVAAIALAVILVILVILFFTKRYSGKLMKLYHTIKKKIFWNAFIRYLLQETLKLQIMASAIIVLTTSTGTTFDRFMNDRSESVRLLEDSDDNLWSNFWSNLWERWKRSEVQAPIIVLVVLNLLPLFFIFTMCCNRKTLKEDKTREAIGTLYQTIQPTSISSLTYPLVFLMRRTLFVVVTFVLFEHPVIQTQVLI